MSYGQLEDRGTVRAIQERFGLDPDFTLSMMPEVAAVVTFDMPELLLHQGWRRWTCNAGIGAVGAQRGRSQMRNPGTSGMLILIEAIFVSSGIAGSVGGTFGQSGPDLSGASSTPAPRDGRMGTQAGSVGVLTVQTDASPFLNNGGDLVLQANVLQEFIPFRNQILVPGNILQVDHSTVNGTLNVTWVWRERPLQEQENTP